jgi:hypothetical protein
VSTIIYRLPDRVVPLRRELLGIRGASTSRNHLSADGTDGADDRLARVSCVARSLMIRVHIRPSRAITAAFAFAIQSSSLTLLSVSRPVTAVAARRCILAYSIFRSRLRDCLIKSPSCRRSAVASRVKNPCLKAFLLPRGAPDPAAPPCMQQRLLPPTAVDRQGLPERVLAPQRWLDSMGPVSRG